jgi:hypothetical protein
MSEKAKCPDDNTTIRSYDGMLGYECTFCPKCGRYWNMNGEGKSEDYIGHSGPEDVYARRKAIA